MTPEQEFSNETDKIDLQLTNPNRLLGTGDPNLKPFLRDGAALDVFCDEKGQKPVRKLFKISERAGIVSCGSDGNLPFNAEVTQVPTNAFDDRSTEPSIIQSGEQRKASDPWARPARQSSIDQYGERAVLSGQQETGAAVSSTFSRTTSPTGTVLIDNATKFSKLVYSENQKAHARVKLLALLVFAGVTLRSSAWKVFLDRTLSNDESFSDENLLPFETYADVDKVFVVERKSDKAFNAFLHRQQFVVCPRFIEEIVKITNNHKEVILPYTHIEKVDPSRDDLFFVEIAPGHRNLATRDRRLVRKDICRASREIVIGEHLRRNQTKSNYLVVPCAVISDCDKVSILMPTAQGNLLQLMTNGKLPRCPSSNRSPDLKIEDFKKIFGPGCALEHLHNGLSDETTWESKAIRHGDVTPRNILLVEDDDGNWSFHLADFGASDVKIGNGRFEVNGQQGDECDYLAPEGVSSIYNNPKTHPDVPRPDCSADVWSFGCIVLEWLAVLTQGTTALERFRAQRENVPRKETGQKRNERYFTVHLAQENDLVVDNTDLRTAVETSSGEARVVFRRNADIDAFFKKLRSECKDSFEADFIRRIVHVVTTVALVPNPARRGTITKLLNELKKAAKSSWQHYNRQNYLWQLIWTPWIFLGRLLWPWRESVTAP